MVLKLFEGFKAGFREVGEVLAGLVNLLLLSLVYLAGVGLTSIVAKIFGKHFLNLKQQKDKKTYYEELNLSKESKETYYRQF